MRSIKLKYSGHMDDRRSSKEAERSGPGAAESGQMDDRRSLKDAEWGGAGAAEAS